MIKRLIASTAFFLLPLALFGQASPARRGGIPAFRVGAYYSNFSPDYIDNRLSGAGIFIDWDLLGKLGVEGEARWLRFNQQQGAYEDNYLVGPRYARRYGRLIPYVKFLMGAGELEFPAGEGHGGYWNFVPGGGLDFRVNQRFTIRAIDYEYQFWPSAPGGGLPTHGLTPNGFSIGGSYRIF